jgi:hypothetical protein
MNSNEPKRLRHGLMIIVATVLLATFIVLGIYVYKFAVIFGMGLSSSQETWGQFGDYVGGLLNPFFALAALLALLYTILLQQRELSNTVKALNKQNSTLKKQNIESTFFQLLNLNNNIVTELQLHIQENRDGFPVDEVNQLLPFRIASPTINKKYRGRDCLKKLHFILLRAYISKVDRGDYVESRGDALSIEYNHFYEKYGHLVGHYFRTLYNIVKFVDESDLASGEKKSYVNLVRAQLSKYELGLLLYSCLSKHGTGFARWVLHYHLLKHIEPDAMANPEDKNLLTN